MIDLLSLASGYLESAGFKILTRGQHHIVADNSSSAKTTRRGSFGYCPLAGIEADWILKCLLRFLLNGRTTRTQLLTSFPLLVQGFPENSFNH